MSKEGRRVREHKTGRRGVFRPAYQHRELSGVGSWQQGKRCRRSGAGFRSRNGHASVESADAILAAAEKARLKITRVLETHAHADHLSAAPYIKQKTGATVGIGEHIREVQQIFRPIFNATDVSGDGSEFDHLFKDGERFNIGALQAEVIYTPGHTPACVSYRIGDRCFHRRHTVYAGLRHRAGRFPRRRCPHALPLDQAAARSAAGNPAVPVP